MVGSQKVSNSLEGDEVELFEGVAEEDEGVLDDVLGEERGRFLLLELLAELIFELIESLKSEFLAEADDRGA